MDQLAQQEPTPAICNAISRSAQTLINIRRRADEEMELIRTEEIQAAAADIAGAHPDLEAAADINARLERFSSEALVEQGYAEFKASDNPDDPPDVVLNDRGRLRFGFYDIYLTQKMLTDVERVIAHHNPDAHGALDSSHNIHILNMHELDVQDMLTALAHGPETPVDPLTGQPFTKVPLQLKVRNERGELVRCDQDPQERLPELLDTLREYRSKLEELSEGKKRK